MYQPGSRIVALTFLTGALLLLLLICHALARRSSRPFAVWGAGGYLALLHGTAIAGVADNARFAESLAPLTLLTFPFSMSLFDTSRMQGFASAHDLAVNYVRYILEFGGLNAMLFAGFLVLALPPRRP